MYGYGADVEFDASNYLLHYAGRDARIYGKRVFIVIVMRLIFFFLSVAWGIRQKMIANHFFPSIWDHPKTCSAQNCSRSSSLTEYWKFDVPLDVAPKSIYLRPSSVLCSCFVFFFRSFMECTISYFLKLDFGVCAWSHERLKQ